LTHASLFGRSGRSGIAPRRPPGTPPGRIGGAVPPVTGPSRRRRPDRPRPFSFPPFLPALAAVTPDEVREVARDILGQRPSLSVIGPLKDKQAARLHDVVA